MTLQDMIESLAHVGEVRLERTARGEWWASIADTDYEVCGATLESALCGLIRTVEETPSDEPWADAADRAYALAKED